jgi:hypothetical protein
MGAAFRTGAALSGTRANTRAYRRPVQGVLDVDLDFFVEPTDRLPNRVRDFWKLIRPALSCSAAT